MSQNAIYSEDKLRRNKHFGERICEFQLFVVKKMSVFKNMKSFFFSECRLNGLKTLFQRAIGYFI